MKEVVIHSWGGGTQSIALAVLYILGILPKPDHIVFADTSREASETMEYFENNLKSILQRERLDFHIVSHDYATVDLYGKNSDLLIPTFTATGKLPTYCSNEWKKRVVSRYLRKALHIKKCRMWIGFSIDELERMKDSGLQWIKNEYPLIDMNITREECRKIVLDFGLPEPPRSSCWCCPHRNNDEWLRLKNHYPKDFNKAIELEEKINVDDELYLHRSLVKLKDNDFKKGPKRENSCETGHCFT